MLTACWSLSCDSLTLEPQLAVLICLHCLKSTFSVLTVSPIVTNCTVVVAVHLHAKYTHTMTVFNTLKAVLTCLASRYCWFLRWVSLILMRYPLQMPPKSIYVLWRKINLANQIFLLYFLWSWLKDQLVETWKGKKKVSEIKLILKFHWSSFSRVPVSTDYFSKPSYWNFFLTF